MMPTPRRLGSLAVLTLLASSALATLAPAGHAAAAPVIYNGAGNAPAYRADR